MQPALPAVAALVFLPFLAAAVTPIVYRVLGERTAYFAAAVSAVCLGLVASQYGTQGTVALGWAPSIGVAVRFYVDGLALLIGFLASGVGVLILTYSGAYMHDEPGQARYYTTLLVFLGAMLGIAFAADLIALFVFWELTSVASFILIGHYRRTEASRIAARKSMLITVAGGLFMLVGFLLLRDVAGTYNLAAMLADAGAIREELRAVGLYVPVVVLLAIGAAAKSAQVPLHIWLPDAMEAPTPVSAFLHSATMVKAGVYLVGRFRPLLLEETWTVLLLALGLTTMTVAAMLAVAATDIKELLAYSTASHLGLIIAGFGFASDVGAETGAFHILNHALFKAALFLVAGIVAHEAGTRMIDDLGGLYRELPVTAGVTVIAALGMAGVPPFNGFYSKELLFEAAYEAAVHDGGLAWLLPAVAVFGSVFTFLYSIRFLMLFFGERPAGLGEVHRPPVVMLAPPALLGGLALVVGLRPGLAIEAIAGSAAAGAGGPATFSIGLPTELKPPVLMSAVTIGVGLIAYPAYGRVHDALRDLLTVGPLRAGWYYRGAVDGLEPLGEGFDRVVQTGRIRTYAAAVLGGTSLLVLAGYAATGAGLPAFAGFAVVLPTALVVTVAVIAALAVARAPSHIAGVLTLSIVGFMIAIFYILASAPDLALTQLVVETLVLVIFLLVLNRLPAFYGSDGWPRLARDGVLSLLVGGTVATTVLVATGATPDNEIRTYFVENAVSGGGGGNVVNVILVDFRAFDTMGEIAVVAMAAMSVLALIGMRQRGETQQ